MANYKKVGNLVLIFLPLIVLVGILSFWLMSKTVVWPYIIIAKEFVTQKTPVSSESGRTNILLLGVGGAGHDGPQLTDTIMVASIDRQTGKVYLISLPRDIWIDSQKAKLNATYEIGKKAGLGVEPLKSVIKDITGLPIHYVVVIDFSGVKNIIDILGGLDINVVNGFVDKQYPIEGSENDLCNGDKTYSCRYKTVSFDAGTQHLDSGRVMEYIRSRHADGIEGSDLARGARQQIVVESLKARLLDKRLMSNPKKLFDLATVSASYVWTDMSLAEIGHFSRLMFDARGQVVTLVFPQDMLTTPTNSRPYLGQFVFLPKSGNWEDLKKWIIDQSK